MQRNLYKRIDGTAVIFEEVDDDLGLRFRWKLSACERFGVVRHATIEDIAGAPVDVREYGIRRKGELMERVRQEIEELRA